MAYGQRRAARRSRNQSCRREGKKARCQSQLLHHSGCAAALGAQGYGSSICGIHHLSGGERDGQTRTGRAGKRAGGQGGRFFRYGYFLDLFAQNRRFSVGRQHGGGSKDDKRNQKNSPQTRFENFRNLRARTRAQRSRSQHSHARGQGF